MQYNQDIEYAGSFTGLDEFLQRAPQHHKAYGWLVDRPVNRALMQVFLQPALDFSDQTRRDLYCGEFGVIEHVTPQSRQNWHRDLLEILKQRHIGWAVWSYKQMDFGLVNGRGDVVDPVLIDILRKV